MREPYLEMEDYEADREERMNRLPICCNCGNHILQDKAVCYDDEWYCEDCELDLWYKVREEYLERIDDV